MLRELNLKAVYDSSECDLVSDLIVPLLQNSVKYDRGVGYFTSGWLQIASAGLNTFADEGGIAHIIMSPIISVKDWAAMEKGEKAQNDPILLKQLILATQDLGKALKEDTLNAFAWLIADEVLHIKFAIPTGKLEGGDFHDKFAVFRDAEGNRVAIHGSFNDSIHGSLNGESFSVFKSWESAQLEYVDNHNRRFDLLWNNQNKMFNVFTIPQAVKDKIITYRKYERPYKQPNTSIEIMRDSHSIVLRDYQLDAVNNWKESNCSGIFEMATGTGKTITSLTCADMILKEKGSLALVVVVPFLHLIEQWNRELKKYGFAPVLCSSQHSNWENDLQLIIQDYNPGFRKIISCIVTHSTASLEKFQNIVGNITKGTRMSIFDEVHALGAPLLRRALLMDCEYKIGLSATPQRWYDDQGTELLLKYFGGVCYTFPLEKAIGPYLVPYRYIPHIVEMSENEYYEYCQLSTTIAKLFHSDKDLENNTGLQSLLRKRRSLINNAEAKKCLFLTVLDSLLQEYKKSMLKLSHTLFYCPVGEHKNILKLVADKGIASREFVHTVGNVERQEVLGQFARGDIDALVAIKCLDEGVDIPATKLAFILASTTNPREFIQRRGRILRKHEGKSEAIIHDFIVVPPLSKSEIASDIDEYKIDILKREMPRFAEFSSAAKNEYEAKKTIKDILIKFDVMYLLSMRPWDIYSENKLHSIDNKEEVEDV